MGIRITGAGCCLMDILHPKVDFASPAFAALRSRKEGDGGLSPGHLVFAEDAEVFGGRPFPELLATLVGSTPPAAENVGGPSVVSLIHAAQVLEGEGAEVSFLGARGGDALGERLLGLLRRTPLELGGYRVGPGRTPSTVVLSDPSWNGGAGERCFVNEIGAAAAFAPAEIGDAALSADLVALGGTGLVPGLHEGLPEVLAAARRKGALTLVNTVFDFRSERRAPDRPWPLGGPGAARISRTGPGAASGPGDGPGPASSYHNCDLLVMDRDEALRLSGSTGMGTAVRFFAGSGVGAFVITRGGEDLVAWAGGGRFVPLGASLFPVIGRSVSREAALAAGIRLPSGGGDTTGCGDTFVGGLIAALARQVAAGKDGALDLGAAIGQGVAAGSLTLSVLGGTWFESRPGEKREAVEAVLRLWTGDHKEFRDGS